MAWTGNVQEANQTDNAREAGKTDDSSSKSSLLDRAQNLIAGSAADGVIGGAIYVAGQTGSILSLSESALESASYDLG